MVPVNIVSGNQYLKKMVALLCNRVKIFLFIKRDEEKG